MINWNPPPPSTTQGGGQQLVRSNFRVRSKLNLCDKQRSQMTFFSHNNDDGDDKCQSG